MFSSCSVRISNIVHELAERFGEFADLLFVFDLNDSESFYALTPDILNNVKEALTIKIRF